MTRIMAWNIQFFTDVNLSTETRAAAREAAHLVDAVGVAEPDILSVIEVRTGDAGYAGALIKDTGGALGVRMLLDRLQARDPSWCVVPPVQLNQQPDSNYVSTKTTYFEAIAVFFKCTDLQFVGPQVWNGKYGVARSAPPSNASAYGDPWDTALLDEAPDNRCGIKVKNKWVKQNQLAGQVIFPDAHNHALVFPAAWARMPLYTAFWDTDKSRVIKVVSVHLPPGRSFAQQAAEKLGAAEFLAQVNLPVAAPAAPEVRVILGDFNINANADAQAAYLASGGLSGYKVILRANPDSDQPWRKTMLRRLATAHPPPLHKDWMRKESAEGPYLGLDNILLENSPGPNAYIGRGIWNWPAQKKPAHTRYPQAYMSRAWDQISDDDVFKSPDNYGKIRNTSDHLAVSIDV